jgi:uncharacterized GH25 family protein
MKPHAQPEHRESVGATFSRSCGATLGAAFGRIRAPRALLTGTVVAALALSAAAHDFWIQPSHWLPAAKELVSFDLRVGHPGESEPFGRHPHRIRRFTASRAGAAPGAPGAEVAIVGRDGRAPAGFARFEAEGLYRVAYESHPVWIELAPAKFASYLAEEGLEKVAQARVELGEAESPGLELYARCAVAVVPVGAGAAAATDYGAPLGLALELVPEGNPAALAVGEVLAVRLLAAGEPLAGALVVLDPLDGQDVPSQQARTDEDGRVRFTIAAAGGHLATAVDMQRAPDDVRTRSEQRADWTSQWASLAFAVPAP